MASNATYASRNSVWPVSYSNRTHTGGTTNEDKWAPQSKAAAVSLSLKAGPQMTSIVPVNSNALLSPQQVMITRDATHQELLGLHVVQYVKLYQKATLLQKQVEFYQKEHEQHGERITAIYNKLHSDSDQAAPSLCQLQPRPSPEYKFYELSEWTDFIDPKFPKLTHSQLTQCLYFVLNPDGSHALTPDWAKKAGAWSREARDLRKDVSTNVKSLCRILRLEDPDVVIPEKFGDWKDEWKERLYAMTYPLYTNLAICAAHYKLHLIIDSLDLWKTWIKQFSTAGSAAEVLVIKTEPDVEETAADEAATGAATGGKRKNANPPAGRVRKRKPNPTENNASALPPPTVAQATG